MMAVRERSTTDLVILLPSLHVGGTERQVVLLARGIAEFHPDLAARTSIVTIQGGGEFEQHVPAPIRVIALSDRRTNPLASALRFWMLLRLERPRVVYSLLAPANLVSAAASLRWQSRRIWGHRSAVYTVRSDRRETLVRFLLRLGSTRCDGVVVNSEAAAHFVETLPARCPIWIIRNVVDSTEFHPDRQARESARDELHIGVDEPLVLSVGRLVADKDHPTLLRAFAAVVTSGSSAHLAIVGGGTPDAATALGNLAEELGIDRRLHLLGSRADVNRWYNAADILVQSSANEGQSNVLAEAMSVGCPVVSTDCGDASRVLPPSNVVPIGDDARLARAVLRVLTARAAREPSRVGASLQEHTSEVLTVLGVGPVDEATKR